MMIANYDRLFCRFLITMRTVTDHAHAPAPPEGKPWLAVEHLCVRYGSRDVVTDLSFALPQGAIACLLGPSGCGKPPCCAPWRARSPPGRDHRPAHREAETAKAHRG